ncbi:hypothetical protein A1507_04325 [Methylomonas koyamae]|uniref:Uncharacterized protein n=1 Tax=Methylomonas koyamae TaxID=702114 RepID=A0A177MVY8_9GAMM|nr:hypothetical protein A1507_04325 [Methylomonas koyamae]
MIFYVTKRLAKQFNLIGQQSPISFRQIDCEKITTAFEAMSAIFCHISFIGVSFDGFRFALPILLSAIGSPLSVVSYGSIQAFRH